MVVYAPGAIGTAHGEWTQAIRGLTMGTRPEWTQVKIAGTRTGECTA